MKVNFIMELAFLMEKITVKKHKGIFKNIFA